MAFQGPLSPSTGTSSGSPAWNSPTRIIASDDSRATNNNVPAGTTTGTLTSSGHGFSIPVTATIDGILLEIERTGDGTDLKDNSVRLVTGGTAVGDNKASATAWPGVASETHVSYGGATDTWGRTWTPAEINASTFGGAVSAINTSATTARDARVDHIRITVWYTDGGGTTFVDGASAPSATGNLTATGVVIVDGSSAPSGTPALTASGEVVVDGSASLSVTGNLSASGGVLSEGSAVPSAIPSLSATGVVLVDGTAQPTATGVLTASGTEINPEAGVVEGFASPHATGNLAASGLVLSEGASSPSATPNLSASAGVVVDASASPVATPGLTALGAVLSEGSASLTATPGLLASGLVVVDATATLTALGAIVASGVAFDPDSLVTEFKLRRGLQTGMRAGVP